MKAYRVYDALLLLGVYGGGNAQKCMIAAMLLGLVLGQQPLNHLFHFCYSNNLCLFPRSNTVLRINVVIESLVSRFKKFSVCRNGGN